MEELGCHEADFVDGALKRFLGSRRRVLDAGDFAYELSGGLLDFIGTGLDADGLSESFD